MILSREEKIKIKEIEDRMVLKYYLLEGIRTKLGLRNFLLELKEPKVSDRVNCGKNHVAPFQVLYEILTEKVKDFIVWANRAGSKSYLAGLISWYKSGNRKLMETCILGGSESQSEKSYKAMNDFWRISGLMDDFLEKEPMITKTVWKNRSIASILTASQRSVRGPHPQSLILDEVDEMELEIFEAALSQPMSRFNIPSSIGILSTNHNIGGTMDHALGIAEKGGFKLYKYCIWECVENCKDYSCSSCKLSQVCPGKQIKKANGYYMIEDLIKKLEQLSWDSFQREWLCEKIGRGDLVYQNEFDEDLHVIDRPYDPGKFVYLSLDWGGVNPFSVGVWQKFDDMGWVRVEEVYQGNTTNQNIIKTCKKRPWWESIIEGVGDPSRNDLIQEWGAEGVDIVGANNDVDEGIEAVKNALRPVIGNPKFYINRLCVDSRREFLAYAIKKGKIVKENDHTQDESRYFVMWKIKEEIGEAAVYTPKHDTSPEG